MLPLFFKHFSFLAITCVCVCGVGGGVGQGSCEPKSMCPHVF